MLVSMLALETRCSSSPFVDGRGLYLPSFQLRASSFDTSFDNAKPDSDLLTVLYEEMNNGQ